MSNAQAPPPQDGPVSLRIRAMAVLVVVVCLFSTLVGRLWYLQGVEAKTPIVEQIANLGQRTIYIPAPRGDIFDRDGVLLAGNHIEQVVTVQPGAELAHPGIVGALSAILGEPANLVKAAILNNQYSPYQPVPVAEGVPGPVVLAIDEDRAELPGVQVQAEPVRFYPHATTMANIIGYVYRITAAEYKDTGTQMCGPLIPCYQPTSLVGQAGVEAGYESYLRGTPGKAVVEVDSRGDVLGTLSYTPPVPGDNLVLSVSLTDQQAAVNALAYGVNLARTGPNSLDSVSGQKFRAPAASLVVEDPRNGQILAMASYPDYNPDDFIHPGGISNKRWDYYNNPAHYYPMIDRAISSPYQPGSTWKLITATADVDYGLRSPAQYYNDTGSFTVGNQIFHDNADSGLGPVDLQGAITVSSDAYFYSLGYQFWQLWANQRAHPEYLQRIASQYGFGHYSGVDLSGESPGIVPSQEVFTREHQQFPTAYPDPYFSPGQEIQEAIGEGQDEVTPLQLTNAYATFANGGSRYEPQVVMAVEKPGTANKPNGKILRYFPAVVKDHVEMPDATGRGEMLSGFEGVTTNSGLGTAAAAFADFPLNRYPVAGKTGTAQVEEFCAAGTKCVPGSVAWPAYKQDTSVFASFGPAMSPRFAVSAVFEQAGYGASVAAPAVKQMYLTLFGIKRSKGGTAPTSTSTTTTTSSSSTTTAPTASSSSTTTASTTSSSSSTSSSATTGSSTSTSTPVPVSLRVRG